MGPQVRANLQGAGRRFEIPKVKAMTAGSLQAPGEVKPEGFRAQIQTPKVKSMTAGSLQERCAVTTAEHTRTAPLRPAANSRNLPHLYSRAGLWAMRNELPVAAPCCVPFVARKTHRIVRLLQLLHQYACSHLAVLAGYATRNCKCCKSAAAAP
jgi:hypothetical protein